MIDLTYILFYMFGMRDEKIILVLQQRAEIYV